MNKKTIVLILLIAVSIVCFKYMLRSPLHHVNSKAPVETLTVPMLRDSVKQSEKVFQEKIKVLNRKNDSLAKQLKHLRLIMEQTSVKEKMLQKSVMQFIAKDTSKEVVQRIQDCDSIKSKIKILITQSQIQDSLCEQSQSVLQTTCSNKDSMIVQQQTEYYKLKLAFNQSLQQDDYLQKDNKYLFKTAQRKTFSNRLLSAGLLVFVSATAINILQHHL